MLSMALLGLKVKEVGFEEDSLFMEVGKYKIYYPETNDQYQRIAEIIDLLNANKNDEDILANANVELINMLTNIEITKEEWNTEKKKRMFNMKLRTVVNYIGIVIDDTLEMLNSEYQVLKRTEKYKNANDDVEVDKKQELLNEWKAKENERNAK